jgi:hypothetical protein
MSSLARAPFTSGSVNPSLRCSADCQTDTKPPNSQLNIETGRSTLRYRMHLRQQGRWIMQIPHDTFVRVADGRKMLFYRHEGDAAALDLQVELAEEHADAPDRNQRRDAAGRASSTQSGASAPAVARGGFNQTMARGGGA